MEENRVELTVTAAPVVDKRAHPCAVAGTEASCLSLAFRLPLPEDMKGYFTKQRARAIIQKIYLRRKDVDKNETKAL